jgi:hypothetical protein
MFRDKTLSKVKWTICKLPKMQAGKRPSQKHLTQEAQAGQVTGSSRQLVSVNQQTL